ncbi:unnamed protein product [Chrysodeixis includens]|uniref:Serpin domain-containing protein n=1 Tax=Chrysodeixis includens TaxID=689277 RepID=A0A9P0FXB9_CHRIL|nr:unnamed protein product [Chrysodeixis includens]
MLLPSLTICCLILNAQSQSFFQNNPVLAKFLNPDRIYFNDNFSLVQPLSRPATSQVDDDAIRQIFGPKPTENPKKKPATSVEIEKSNEIGYSTSVERVTNRNEPVRNVPIRNVESQQTYTPAPNRQTSEQVVDRQVGTQQASRRQTTVPQPSPDTRPQSSMSLPEPPPVSGSGFNSLLYSVTNFGITLLKNVNAVQPGNVVLSPFSITTLLALLQQGALGQTQEQITAALQMTSVNSASAYSKISQDIKKRSSRNILKTGNSIFIANGFSINPDFKTVAQNSFDSDVTPLSYNRPEMAAQEINGWVASKTENKITKLISPDTLSSSTQMVLVNAVYFKGLWEIPFRPESTIGRNFHLSNGQIKTAQFMRMRKLFRSGRDPATNAKIVVLPFEREEYYLMMILPSELVGMQSTLQHMTDARLLSYLSFPPLDTEIEIPKFTVRADTNLNTILRTMGITKMFGPYSELNRLGMYRAYSPQISSAVHSAVFSIDEQGGSAAAATAFAAVALSYDEPSAVFKADRPFIAILWDAKTSLPIFMTKIEDPQV